MNRIESAYTAFRATVVIPRDKNWDDILLVKPAEKKRYVKVAVKKKREAFSKQFKL